MELFLHTDCTLHIAHYWRRSFNFQASSLDSRQQNDSLTHLHPYIHPAQATAVTKELLQKDEYLLEVASDARPLQLFQNPESLFTAAATSSDVDQVMQSITLSLTAAKVVAKSLKKSVDDLAKLKKSLDKARQAFEAKKLAAQKVTEEASGTGQGQAAGRTSWTKLLTENDLPIVQCGRALMATRPMKVWSSAAKDSESYPGVDVPLVFRRGFSA